MSLRQNVIRVASVFFRLSVLTGIILLGLSLGEVVSKPLFVSVGPPMENSLRGKHIATIYDYDTESGKLRELWKSPPNLNANGMRLYSRNQIFLLAVGSWDRIEQIYTVLLKEPLEFLNVDVAKYDRIFNFGLSEEATGVANLQLVAQKENSAVQSLIISATTGKELRTKTLSNGSERRIAGSSSPYYGRTGDAVSFRRLTNGQFQSFMEELYLDGSAVPDSVIHRKESSGWTLVTNEPTFRAFLSVAERAGYTDSELLIYDRQKDVWQSTMIPGSATSLRLINGWLTGVIADMNPRTDYERRVGGSHVLHEEVFLLHPEDGQQLTVHLGKQCEILWINNDDVYFRLGKALYRGSLEGNNITNRQKIFEAPFVLFIHWAFAGD